MHLSFVHISFIFFVRTHRHPLSAVPSMSSLLKGIHQVYYEPECRNDSEIGLKVHQVSSNLLIKAPNDIIESKLQCNHVIYEDLIKNPIEIIKSIYKQFQWNYTNEYNTILLNYLEDDRIKRNALKTQRQSEKLHTYYPEEFGLTEKMLSEGNYDTYVKKFNVPISKN